MWLGLGILPRRSAWSRDGERGSGSGFGIELVLDGPGLQVRGRVADGSGFDGS
jgi:hypothetical protein